MSDTFPRSLLTHENIDRLYNRVCGPDLIFEISDQADEEVAVLFDKLRDICDLFDTETSSEIVTTRDPFLFSWLQWATPTQTETETVERNAVPYQRWIARTRSGMAIFNYNGNTYRLPDYYYDVPDLELQAVPEEEWYQHFYNRQIRTTQIEVDDLRHRCWLLACLSDHGLLPAV